MKSTFAVIAFFLLNLNAFAERVIVMDQSQKPIQDAVVFVKGEGLEFKKTQQKMFSIVQNDKNFESFVSVVPVGALVDFPNKDDVKHHVYSFSDPKPFEIKLYKDFNADPILMDNPGVVVLGCNIHDWMVSYLYVTDSNFFALTNKQGVAIIPDLPEGNFTLYVWHPGLKSKTEYSTPITATGQSINVVVDLKPSFLWEPQQPDGLHDAHSY